MLYLIGGVVLLFGLMLLGRAFVNADPKQLARFVKWAAIALAAAAVVALAVSGRLSMLLALAAGLLPLLRRLHSADRRPARTVGRDHLRGRDVLRAHEPRSRYRRDDRHGAAGQLRRDAARRDAPRRSAGAAARVPNRRRGSGAARRSLARPHRPGVARRSARRAGRRRSAAARGGADITVEEAYAILGLQPGADAAAIKAAHHRLMKQLHPDHGGTDYFAAKINRARDVLLNR